MNNIPYYQSRKEQRLVTELMNDLLLTIANYRNDDKRGTEEADKESE